MRYLVLLFLLTAPAIAEPMDDLDDILESMDYRLDNVEKDVRQLKSGKAQQATPNFQFPQVTQPLQNQPPAYNPPQQPAYQRPPCPDPKDPAWRWSDRLGKWFYFDGAY